MEPAAVRLGRVLKVHLGNGNLRQRGGTVILSPHVWSDGEDRGMLGDESIDEALQSSFEVDGGAVIQEPTGIHGHVALSPFLPSFFFSLLSFSLSFREVVREGVTFLSCRPLPF